MKKKMFYGADRNIFENAKALRNHLTAHEMMFWGILKTTFPQYKFRRQHPISNYIADFYCHPLKLVIEIDGSIHDLQEIAENDIQRQKNIECLDLHVIRFTNNEIKNEIENVLKRLTGYINEIKKG